MTLPYTRDGAGYQKTDTSEKAARALRSRAPSLRRRVLAVLVETGAPVSTDGIARRLGEDYGSVQPRLTKLRRSGDVRDSELRGRTAKGRSCILWEATEKAKESQ
jgi:predicted ArsR family transcriptional regulator